MVEEGPNTLQIQNYFQDVHEKRKDTKANTEK